MSEEKSIKQPKKRKFHKTRKACGVSFAFLMEIFLICLMLVILAGGVLIYKLSKDELDIEFAKRHLEETINEEIAPYHIETGAFEINWPNIFERPTFFIRQFSFLNENNEALLTLEDLSFTFSRSRIFLGEFLPRRVKAKGLDLHFVKFSDGSIQLGFVAGPSYMLFDGKGGGERGEFTSLDDIYQNHFAPLFEDGFLRGLREMNIEDSSIVFEDIGKDYALSFPRVDASLKPMTDRLQLDVELEIKDGIERDFFSTKTVYNSKFKELGIAVRTKNFNPFLWASLFEMEEINAEKSKIEIDADMQFGFDDQFNLQTAEVQTDSREGYIDVPVLYDHPFEFKHLSLNGFFNRQSLTFDLKESYLDAYGLRILLDSNLPIFSKSAKEYTIPIRIKSEEFTMPLQEKAFPDKHEDKPIYLWLTERISKGTVRNFDMELVLELLKDDTGKWDGDLSKLIGSFSFEDLTADYKAPMIPITGTSGKAEIDSGPDKMTITASGGKFENIDLSEIQIDIVDLLADKKSTVSLDFKAKGPFQGYLNYLSKDPINIYDKIDFDPKAVEGNADLHAKLRFQTKEDLPFEEIFIDIEGTFANALIPKLVNGLDVSADKAEFSLKEGLMKASGAGKLSGREGTYTWQQYIMSEGKPFKMKVDANLVSDVNLRRHFGVDIEDYLTGPAALDLIYTSYRAETADLAVTANLKPSQLHFDILGYHKPSGQDATASLNAKLKNNNVQSISDLNITAPELSIQNARLDFVGGDLKRGVFSQNRIGATNARLDLTYDTAKHITLKIEGDTFDARTLLSGEKTQEDYSGPAIRTYMDVKEILTHEDQRVAPGKVYMTMLENGDINQFEMDGQAGNGKVYIRYKPGPDGSPSLQAEFGDAGAALKTFGMYQNARGGTLIITGTSSDPTWKGNVSGHYLMQNFAVRDAPVLAKLINAMSLPGLGQLLNNDGVVFSKLRANFQWNSRPEGAIIAVRDGRTSGSELGLTFEGFIDRSNNSINMEGTIVPVSTLNNLIGDIPLLGPVITGGTGALIAATYKIKGPYQTAEVRINPLSALAPGVIRKILFED